MTEPRWLIQARKYIGLHEAPGAADNPKVVRFYALAGHPEVKHDSVPWCAAFVGGVLAECGINPTGTLWALDYAKWGQKLVGPMVGAIATKKRRAADGSVAGHVFFVAAYNKTHVTALGGNQSDSVCMQMIPISEITAFRWPADEPIPMARATSGRMTGKAGLSEA